MYCRFADLNAAYISAEIDYQYLCAKISGNDSCVFVAIFSQQKNNL